jgi:hypothetical protein
LNAIAGRGAARDFNTVRPVAGNDIAGLGGCAADGVSGEIVTKIVIFRRICDRFAGIYNRERPHRSLPQRATPAVAYAARPKAAPPDSGTDTHYRVRHDRVDKTGRVTLRVAGRLHHIGLGHEHAQTRVVMLIADLDVRVINAATGELLRHLTLDPTRDYQPTGKPRGPKRRSPSAQRGFTVSSMS